MDLMRGTVLGPASDGDPEKVWVEFENPAGRWNLPPANLSRTRLRPEDIVCHVWNGRIG